MHFPRVFMVMEICSVKPGGPSQTMTSSTWRPMTPKEWVLLLTLHPHYFLCPFFAKCINFNNVLVVEVVKIAVKTNQTCNNLNLWLKKLVWRRILLLHPLPFSLLPIQREISVISCDSKPIPDIIIIIILYLKDATLWINFSASHESLNFQKILT